MKKAVFVEENEKKDRLSVQTWECNISEFPKGLRIEMTMKMGFPMGMGIRLQRGNGNGKECEWQQMGMEITCILMGEILTDFLLI